MPPKHDAPAREPPIMSLKHNPTLKKLTSQTAPVTNKSLTRTEEQADIEAAHAHWLAFFVTWGVSAPDFETSLCNEQARSCQKKDIEVWRQHCREPGTKRAEYFHEQKGVWTFYANKEKIVQVWTRRLETYVAAMMPGGSGGVLTEWRKEDGYEGAADATEKDPWTVGDMRDSLPHENSQSNVSDDRLTVPPLPKQQARPEQARNASKKVPSKPPQPSAESEKEGYESEEGGSESKQSSDGLEEEISQSKQTRAEFQEEASEPEQSESESQESSEPRGSISPPHSHRGHTALPPRSSSLPNLRHRTAMSTPHYESWWVRWMRWVSGSRAEEAEALRRARDCSLRKAEEMLVRITQLAPDVAADIERERISQIETEMDTRRRRSRVERSRAYEEDDMDGVEEENADRSRTAGQKRKRER
ncbi:hypothetical protein NX059_012407 [Plenodomus lindquistii]|nr:hypothetical protein NX059_012407 [Plenodomus lindquistii]